MKLDLTSFETVAANLTVEGETCDLPHTKSSTQTETNTDLAQLIEKLGATSVAEIERIIMELQGAKNHLQSKMQRIERETVHYVTFAQLALDTTKIISETVFQLRCTDSHHQHNNGGMPLS